MKIGTILSFLNLKIIAREKIIWNKNYLFTFLALKMNFKEIFLQLLAVYRAPVFQIGRLSLNSQS